VESTAERYAIEAFERYAADAVTVNPYLGGDSLNPSCATRTGGWIDLCAGTSNLAPATCRTSTSAAGSSMRRWPALPQPRWNSRGNCLLVVGATYPRELPEVRAITGDMPFVCRAWVRQQR